MSTAGSACPPTVAAAASWPLARSSRTARYRFSRPGRAATSSTIQAKAVTSRKRIRRRAASATPHPTARIELSEPSTPHDHRSRSPLHLHHRTSRLSIEGQRNHELRRTRGSRAHIRPRPQVSPAA